MALQIHDHNEELVGEVAYVRWMSNHPKYNTRPDIATVMHVIRDTGTLM